MRQVVASTTNRADALDAFRGLAILGMILSGSIPFNDMLPGWMYHAQVPPPHHVFNPDLPGITWVDLVFPFFLFALGAAIPLALSKKLERGMPLWKACAQALLRGVILLFFAIYIQHIKPFSILSNPDTKTWLLSLTGYVLLFPMLLRLPATIRSYFKIAVKAAGFIGAGVLLLSLSYNGKSFSLNRSDIIIIVLANVAFFGTLVWLFTRNNIVLRIGLMGFLIALRLSHAVPGSWTQWLWDATPAVWAYKLYYLQYLFIVIPGTIAGDSILRWMKSSNDDAVDLPADYKLRLSIAALLLFIFIPLNLAGLYVRAVTTTVIADILLCLVGYQLFRVAHTSADRLYKALFNWGTYWLLLGLCFEAFEGGIKKDHPTLSYYFVTAGLASFTYIFFSIIIDYFKQRKLFALLIHNGQNPMVAYISGSNFVMPILALTSLNVLLNKLVINAWLGFTKGFIFTLLVALVTAFCTKKKLFWRT